jgi:hypothetical protein
MKKNIYDRLVSCYYDIEEDTHIVLAYREGNDTLRLVIGKRRTRLIENVDANFLYFRLQGGFESIYCENDCRKYWKYEPQLIGGEFVIDLRVVLSELNLSYRELDSKEFSKTAKFEKKVPCNYIYPYAYGYDKLMPIFMGFLISIEYCKNAFIIGNKEVRHISGFMRTEDEKKISFLTESYEKKTNMDMDDFVKFIEVAKYMDNVTITCEDVTISKDTISGPWCYQARIENDKEEEFVTHNIDLKNEKAGVILYNMLMCTNYQQYKNLVYKIEMLGLQ